MNRYVRHSPSSDLLPWVESISIQESDKGRTYEVLPETGLVMGFQYHGTLSLIDSGRETALQAHGVTGLHEKPRTFRSSDDLGSILVKFRPSGGRNFLRVPASELRLRSQALDEVSDTDGLHRVQDLLSRLTVDRSRIEAVEEFLRRTLIPRESDPLTERALALIHRRRGWIRVSDLTEQLGTSLSPLERRFNDRVGTSPKRYTGLVRLRGLMDNLILDPASLTDFALKVGFHDQAHFIHEFKRMTGMTPRRFIETGRSKDEFLQFDD